MVFTSSELPKCSQIPSSSLSIKWRAFLKPLIWFWYISHFCPRHVTSYFVPVAKQLVRKWKYKRFFFSMDAILTTADCSVVPTPVTATFSHKCQDGKIWDLLAGHCKNLFNNNYCDSCFFRYLYLFCPALISFIVVPSNPKISHNLCLLF